MTKISLYSLLLSISMCSVFSAFGQDITPNESKFSVEILGGFENHTMTTTINSTSDIINNIEGIGALDFSEIIPKSKNGMSFGLRGSYNVWKNFSVYGQFAYSSQGKENLLDIQSLINPILQSTLLPEIPGVDLSTLVINAREVGDYSLTSSYVGVSYSYNYEQFSLQPYLGLGYYNLNTPGTDLDVAVDASYLGITIPLDLKGLFSFEEQSQGNIGFQTGINIVYNINEMFFVGGNLEYNTVNLEYGTSELGLNQEAIPELIRNLIPFDLNTLPTAQFDTKIDYSSIKYGMTFGMKF